MISERIKEARQKQGLSQSELSRRLKVDRTTVCKWESNDREPGSIELIVRLAKELRVTTDYLLGVE